MRPSPTIVARTGRSNGVNVMSPRSPRSRSMNSKRIPPGRLDERVRRRPNAPSTMAGPQSTVWPASSASRSSVKRAGCRNPSAGSADQVADRPPVQGDHDRAEEDVGPFRRRPTRMRSRTSPPAAGRTRRPLSRSATFTARFAIPVTATAPSDPWADRTASPPTRSATGVAQTTRMRLPVVADRCARAAGLLPKVARQPHGLLAVRLLDDGRP